MGYNQTAPLRQAINQSNKQRRKPSTPRFEELHSSRFIAQITGSAGAVHSWKMVYPDQENPGQFLDHPAEITGTENAYGLNGDAADVDTVVEMWLGGVNAGVPFYLFTVGAPGGIWGRITTSSSIGSNRWSYQFTQVVYQHTGVFTDVVGGVQGTAYNTIEANNDASGIQGSGIDVASLPAGFALQPIGIGAVVQISTVVNCDTAATEYVFQAVNQVDGSCS